MKLDQLMKKLKNLEKLKKTKKPKQHKFIYDMNDIIILKPIKK